MPTGWAVGTQRNGTYPQALGVHTPIDGQQWLAIVERGGELQGVALSQDFPTNFGWRGSTYPAGVELVWAGAGGLVVGSCMTACRCMDPITTSKFTPTQPRTIPLIPPC